MTPIEAVLAELDRIAQLPTVANDSGRANSFDCGARWTLRMIREAIDRGAPALPVGHGRVPLELVQTTSLTTLARSSSRRPALSGPLTRAKEGRHL